MSKKKSSKEKKAAVVEVSERKKPEEVKWSIRMSRKIHEKMLYIAKLSEPREVQMLAAVTQNDREFEIEDLFLLKQGVTFGSADFDIQDVAELVARYPHPEKLRGWVHSHVRMGTFWSGTDIATIQRLMTDLGWLVSIVMCTDGSMRGRIDVSLADMQKKVREAPERYQEFRNLLMVPEIVTWDELPVKVEEALTEEEKSAIRAEFEEKVGGSEWEEPTFLHHGERVLRKYAEERPRYQRTLDFSTTATREMCRTCRFWNLSDSGGYMKRCKKSGRLMQGDEGCSEWEEREEFDEGTDSEQLSCTSCRYETHGLTCLKGVDRGGSFYQDRADLHCPFYVPRD